MRDMWSASPDLTINLGDLVSGPFDPAGSADAQMSLGCPTLVGNHDRQLLTGDFRPSDAFAYPLLLQKQLEWMATLPKSLALLDGEVFACHGSPTGGDTGHLLHQFVTGKPILASDDLLRSRLAGVQKARIVLAAHTHIACAATCDGILVVNPGSVGMPDYHRKAPALPLAETGAHRACYAMAERSSFGWSVELRSIAYDHEAAAQQAEKNGRPDTAFGIRTGRVPPIT